MFAVVDRIEKTETGERLAVLAFDDGQRLAVPLAELPPGTRERTVLVIAWAIDADEMRRRHDHVYALWQRVLDRQSS